jgi:hypothetical protein
MSITPVAAGATLGDGIIPQASCKIAEYLGISKHGLSSNSQRSSSEIHKLKSTIHAEDT